MVEILIGHCFLLLAAGAIHAAFRLERAVKMMAFRFFENRLPDQFLKRLFILVQGFNQGYFADIAQTGLEYAICRYPDSIAVMAETVGNRPDETNRSRIAGQLIIFGWLAGILAGYFLQSGM